MKTVLFIATSFWAYGEITIACEFASRLEAAGVTPYFLIPPSHEKIVKNYGFQFTSLLPRNGKVNRLLMQDLESRFRPALVILADFLNYEFCEKHYGLTAEDLQIFSGRLGTFDDFDWAITGKQMDTYGFKAAKFGEIDIRRYGFGLCPCPVANPIDAERDETYYYRLSTRTIPYEINQTEKWKRELGLPTNKKSILFTQATWQETYKQYPDVVSFVEACNGAFDQLIHKLAEDHLVLCIGPEGYFSQRAGGNFIHRSSMPPELFEKHLLATDVNLSRNFVSTSLARMVLSGIPSVNIKNSLFFTEDRPLNPEKLPFQLTEEVAEQLDQLSRCYPFRMFPVGWFKFLTPLSKGNPYLKTFKQVEQFDVNGAIEIINDLLENAETRDQLQENLRQYEGLLDQLPSVEEIITDLMEKKGR